MNDGVYFVIVRYFCLARSKDFYKLVGRIIAWSLFHGGPGGNFLSKSLYNAIAYNGTSKIAHLEDISDKDLREKISSVCLNITFLCCTSTRLQTILYLQYIDFFADQKRWYH
jgi:hypothetical protein